MIIDSHHHHWRIGQNGQVWPTHDLEAIYRDFVSPDLLEATQACGIDGTVAVQSQPSDADTDWLLSVAAETDLILGAVGWLDLTAPSARDRLIYLANYDKFKGVRPMLQGLADGWILNPQFAPALETLSDLDLTFDALIYTRHLEAIRILATRYPKLSIVIDHGAKPPVAGLHSSPEQTLNWKKEMARVAEQPNVFCKISGLVTEMHVGQPFVDLVAYLDHILACFGPERILWGSDWPVLNMRESYHTWLSFTREWLLPLGSVVTAKVLGENALTFYGLSARTDSRPSINL